MDVHGENYLKLVWLVFDELLDLVVLCHLFEFNVFL
jgi:hypothetical protein